ncbi:MAG: hypothetical protein JWN95_1525 [Frankiales bacterium]|nr:hypothetical protein [Frankiales bacterium]
MRIVSVCLVILCALLCVTLVGAPTASADDIGTISGTVTTEGDPSAVADILVVLSSSASPDLSVAPDGTGQFEFDGLADGSYIVHFQVRGAHAGEYVDQWWDGASGANATMGAQPIVVTGGQPVSLALSTLLLVRSPTPVIPGAATVGMTLSSTIGTWYPVPDSFSYQWFAGIQPILGATAASYVVAGADVAQQLSLQITAMRSGADPITVPSNLTSPVAPGVISVVALPQISGLERVGSALSGSNPSWAPVPTNVSYQWYRGSAAINGATATSYLLGVADLGQRVSVRETGFAVGYGTVVVTSLPTEPIAAGVFAAVVPVISGSLGVGKILTATPGHWTPPAAFRYQWYRGTVPLVGATGSSYRAVLADGGTRLRVAVTATSAAYTSATVYSAYTPIVPRPPVTPGAPRIVGSSRFGGVLTAAPGAWGPAGVTISYQWYVGSTRIPGVTGRARSYRPPASAVGQLVHVAVTGSRTQYVSLTRNSLAVREVAARFASIPAPTIIGVARSTAVLTVRAAQTVPAATLHFQWRANGRVVGTGARYRVRPTDVDRRLTVVVIATRTGYVTASRSSAATAIVGGQAYPNCTVLTAAYPHGVAKIGVTRDHVGNSYRALKGPPFFSTTLYNLNIRDNHDLDRDHDGIACER